MKKVIIGLATAGLLLGAGAAFAQTTETKPQGGTTTSPTTQTQPQSQSAPGGERRGTSSQSGERRDGDRGERRGERSGSDRGNVAGRDRGERSSVNVRVRTGGDGYRHRQRHHRIGVYSGGCRTIIVKKRQYGRTVIKRIRRCG
jgi:hypothetical protein